MKMIWENLINFIKDKYAQIAELPVQEKQRLAVYCTVGFCVILTVVVIFSLQGGGEKDDKPQEPERFVIRTPIPADEIFLPEEPDFLPGVLLDRERREVWTTEDAMEFWQDPLRAGEEPWRQKIDIVIEELLERIP